MGLRTLKLFLCEVSRVALTLLRKPPLYSREAVKSRPCMAVKAAHQDGVTMGMCLLAKGSCYCYSIKKVHMLVLYNASGQTYG